VAVVGEVILQFHDDGNVTSAAFTATDAGQHAAAVSAVTAAIPGSVVIDDPWGTQAATQAVAPAASAAPSCVHGPLKAVPGGIAGPNSRNPGKPYGAFWACQAAQGLPKCRLDKTKLPPVPA